jgi:hypothetical protein
VMACNLLVMLPGRSFEAIHWLQTSRQKCLQLSRLPASTRADRRSEVQGPRSPAPHTHRERRRKAKASLQERSSNGRITTCQAREESQEQAAKAGAQRS